MTQQGQETQDLEPTEMTRNPFSNWFQKTYQKYSVLRL
jgi:hypothetical protein